MHQSDDLVVEFDYTDAKGVTTHRVVSPIRFLGRDRFLGLCLSREEPRQFYLERCQNVRVELASRFRRGQRTRLAALRRCLSRGTVWGRTAGPRNSAAN
jgi:predicted DNA-binding transcriptional regulator YafY